MSASASVFESTAGADVRCVISDSSTEVVADRSMIWEASGATQGSTAGQGDAGNLSGMRSFDVIGGTPRIFSLMCRNLDGGGTSTVWDPQITILFVRK